MPTTPPVRVPLSGKRLQLTAIEAEDSRRLTSFFQDMALLSYYIPTTARPLNQAQIEALLADWDDGQTHFVFAIRKNGHLIGLVNLDGLDWANGHAEVGIALTDEGARGQGFATEALGLLIRYCFDELGLHRLWARIIAGNTASLQLFDSLGFVREGALREHVRRQGSYRDMVVMGLLQAEWLASGKRDQLERDWGS